MPRSSILSERANRVIEGAELERLKKAYNDKTVSVRDIHNRFSLTQPKLIRIAKANGWVLRQRKAH